MMRAQSINLCLWVQNTLFERNENTEYTKIWQLLVNLKWCALICVFEVVNDWYKQ